MPDWKSLIRQRIVALRLNGSAEADLVEELAAHLEDRYRELKGGGMSETEAFEAVAAELDQAANLRAAVTRRDLIPAREPASIGDARPARVVEDLWRDLRYALRTMAKSPLFVAFVVLTLGIGIGANTTVFTVLNTLILNPLPVESPSELVVVSGKEAATRSGNSTAQKGAPLQLSLADITDVERDNRVFGSFAAYTSPRVLTLQTAGSTAGVFGELVTEKYFSTLGLRPARGRFFLPEQDGSNGQSAVAVINYGTWQARFGGAEDIVGRSVRLNSRVFTVIGVAPRNFIGVNAIFGPDFWIPAKEAEQLLPGEMKAALSDRSKAVFLGVGRLKRGTLLSQANANVAAVGTNLARAYPATNEGHAIIAQPVREALFSSSTGGSTAMLFGGAALQIVVGIVLLIACSNVANLLLARSAVRQHEISVRLALGASRRRLLRQLLTESVLLGLLSGVIGFLIAYAGLRVLFGTLPGTSNFPQPKLDVTVFAFTLLISLVTGFLFGTIPALRASRADVAETLKEESRTSGRSRRKITTANVLLVGQVAFSFLLLMTAALFLRSIQRAYAIDPGFQTAHLGVIMTSPGQAGFSKAQTTAYYKEVRQSVSRLPGIESVSWSSNIPLWTRAISGIEVEGREQRFRADKVRGVVLMVDRDYFETAGVAIDRGRPFAESDREGTLPVAIVNEKMARDYWAGRAIGRRVRVPGETQMREIVGVARNANYTTWGETAQPAIYVPLEQNFIDAATLYVRTAADPSQVLPGVERVLRSTAPQVLLNVQTGKKIVEGGLFQARTGVSLLGIFGLLALGLASIGLYGILAYSVNQRRREIGMRMALGAGRVGVRRLILRQGMSLVLAGALIGLGGSLAIGRVLGGMLYGVSAFDPASLLAAAITLCSVALLACYLPALRASRLDPLTALREN